MRCDICQLEYENTDKSTLIQKNQLTGKMVCMDCAMDLEKAEKEIERGESPELLDAIKNTPRVIWLEHTDQKESNGCAATKYTIEFSHKINCDWLWKTLDKELLNASTRDAK